MPKPTIDVIATMTFADGEQKRTFIDSAHGFEVHDPLYFLVVDFGTGLSSVAIPPNGRLELEAA